MNVESFFNSLKKICIYLFMISFILVFFLEIKGLLIIVMIFCIYMFISCKGILKSYSEKKEDVNKIIFRYGSGFVILGIFSFFIYKIVRLLFML